MRPPVPFKWKGIHHGYLGIFLWTFGVFFLYMNCGNGLDFLNNIYLTFALVGAYLMTDDLIEHLITADTPCRIIWEWILRKKC